MISKVIDSFMTATQHSYWRGIEMLPVIHEYIEAELSDATRQVGLLASMQNGGYQITPSAAEQILNCCSKKIAQRYQIEEQCRAWRRIKHLGAQELQTICLLESSMVELNKLTQQVLFFVEHFKQASGLSQSKHRYYGRCA